MLKDAILPDVVTEKGKLLEYELPKAKGKLSLGFCGDSSGPAEGSEGGCDDVFPGKARIQSLHGMGK